MNTFVVISNKIYKINSSNRRHLYEKVGQKTRKNIFISVMNWSGSDAPLNSRCAMCFFIIKYSANTMKIYLFSAHFVCVQFQLNKASFQAQLSDYLHFYWLEEYLEID